MKGSSIQARFDTAVEARLAVSITLVTASYQELVRSILRSARTLGFVVEQLELRGGGAPALLQCAGEFVAAGEVDGGKRGADGVIAALLGLLRRLEFCPRVVLAEDRALRLRAFVAARHHAMEDGFAGGGKPRGLEAVAVAAERPDHLDRRRGQRTRG